jgi:signal transduction histidine kinase
MGKSPVGRRKPLQRQLILAYLLILAFSAVTALGAIFAYHYFYTRNADPEALKPDILQSILETARKDGSAIAAAENRAVLDKIMKDNHLTYSIKDMENHIVYRYSPDPSASNNTVTLKDRLSDMWSNFTRKSDIMVPLIDRATGKTAFFLVIGYSSHQVLVEAFIPFLCFIFYTLLFAKRFSRKVRKSLDELAAAIEKIKARDLDFVLESTGEDEIGSLAGAFEEMRKTLRDSLLREWQLEQDRRDMVAAITHDLRTPLAIILGHAEGLQEGLKQDPEKLDRYLGIIEQNSLRVRDLVDDMNELSEIDRPDFELDPRPLDFTGFLRRKIDEMELLAAQKGIRLESQVSDTRPEDGLLSADSAMLSRAIDNLSANCMRFTPNGGVMRFEAIIEDASASFRISDTGPGFSEKDLSNLFKKFYRGDASRSAGQYHSGLGLYIAKSILEKHGGTITASNAPDGGACFNFRIRFP